MDSTQNDPKVKLFPKMSMGYLHKKTGEAECVDIHENSVSSLKEYYLHKSYQSTFPFELKALCFGVKPMPSFNRWKPVVYKITLHQLLDITAPLSCALTTFSAVQSVLPFVLFHLSSPLHILTAEMVVAAQRAPPIPNLCPGAPRH